MLNPGHYVKDRWINCSECGKKVQAIRGNQKTCVPPEPCRYNRHMRLYPPRKQRSNGGQFYCLKCAGEGQNPWHNTPSNSSGSKWQYCALCKNQFHHYGWPHDIGDEHKLGR
jgi:hypothetical protein